MFRSAESIRRTIYSLDTISKIAGYRHYPSTSSTYVCMGFLSLQSLHDFAPNKHTIICQPMLTTSTTPCRLDWFGCTSSCMAGMAATTIASQLAGP